MSAEQLQQSIKSLHEEFASRDPRHSGAISRSEFICVLVRNGGMLPQIEVLAKQFALSGGSAVDYSAFLAHMMRLADADVPQQAPLPSSRGHYRHKADADSSCRRHSSFLDHGIERAAEVSRGRSCSQSSSYSCPEDLSPFVVQETTSSPPPPKTYSAPQISVAQHNHIPPVQGTCSTIPKGKLALRQIFQCVDWDMDGQVSCDDIERSFDLHRIRCSKEEIEVLFESVTERSHIEFADFCTILSRLRPETISQVRDPQVWPECALVSDEKVLHDKNETGPEAPKQQIVPAPISRKLSEIPEHKPIEKPAAVPVARYLRATEASAAKKPKRATKTPRKVIAPEHNIKRNPNVSSTPVRKIEQPRPQKDPESHFVDPLGAMSRESAKIARESEIAMPPISAPQRPLAEVVSATATPISSRSSSRSYSQAATHSLVENRRGPVPLSLRAKLRGRCSELLTMLTNADHEKSGRLTPVELLRVLQNFDPTATGETWLSGVLSVDYIQLVGDLIVSESTEDATEMPQTNTQRHKLLDRSLNIPHDKKNSEEDDLEAKVAAGREKMRKMLNDELSAAVHGDIHGLLEQFAINDPADAGYLDEKTFRRALTSIFKAGQRVLPNWVMDRCVRAAQTPFQPSAKGTVISKSEKNARMAAQKSGKTPGTCDYRFLLTELNLL